MAAVAITVLDLLPFAPDIDPGKAQAMIDDAMATAVLIAPCIAEGDFASDAAAKAIIRGAIIRWHDRGSGANQTQQQTAGPFSQMVTTVSSSGSGRLFWPSEIEDLSKLCSSTKAAVFAIDTAPGGGCLHSDVCALAFGALYCSCGADIAGFPLYEVI